MLTFLSRHKIAWFLVSALALLASLAGVLYPQIYRKVISPEVLPGTISQDVMTVAAALIAILLTWRLKENSLAGQIVMLGILGFYFYAYGIYVIERVYNPLYLVYMAIFGLSFYALVFAVAGIRRDLPAKAVLPDRLRRFTVGFSLLMPVVFYPLWISMLIPLMRSGERIEYLYSVFIIDLCFIMPAFAILAWMSAKKRGLGLLLSPAMYVLGFAILLPLSLGEALKPIYFNLPLDPFGFWMFLALSLAFLVVGFWDLRQLKLSA